MKKILNVSLMLLMFVAMVSCSTTKSFNKSFEKNGYTMAALTPQQQIEIAPVMNNVPSLNENAIAYLVTGDAITFVYKAEPAVWDNYVAALQNAGFSDMGIGLVKADKNAGITYNVSGKHTTVYKESVLIVTYTHAKF